MLTNADCTLYTPYVVDGQTQYARTVLRGVHWQDSEGTSIARHGTKSADSATIYVPMTVEVDGGKTYMPPKAWLSADKSAFWTLAPTGSSVSKIIKGVIGQEITDDYPAKQLDRDYDDVRSITAVDVKDYGSARMQHWRVTAK